MKTKTNEYEYWKKIYNESGVWRKYSFKDFILEVVKTMKKYEKQIENI